MGGYVKVSGTIATIQHKVPLFIFAQSSKYSIIKHTSLSNRDLQHENTTHTANHMHPSLQSNIYRSSTKSA